MASHKAATSVTLAPTEEKSGLALFVHRYWKMGALLAVAATAGILYAQYTSEASRSEHDKSWEKLMGSVQEEAYSRSMVGSGSELLGVAEQTKGKDAAPWALYLAASNAATKQDYATAQRAIDQLKRDYPQHTLVQQKLSTEEGANAKSLVDQLSERIQAQQAWRSSHANLFTNPELPADAPKVKLTTDAGAIVVGLYSNLAPKHAENFLKLAREGLYKGTKFHRVIPGFVIQGGDPNSKEGDPSTWGQGGPGYKIDREESGVKHFAGYLAAAKQGNETQSSGSQFYITVADAHQLDAGYVVFGKVLEGMDVVHTIEKGAIAEGTADRPQNPVTIQATEVLGS